MKAAAAFSDDLKQSGLDVQTERIVIDIYGSLALTGRGHGTFDALLLGLEGSLPHDIPLADIPDRLERIRTQHILRLNGREISFIPDRDLNIRGDQVLPKHPNGLNFSAYGKDGGKLKEQIYYSVGGGFIVTDQEFDKQAEQNAPSPLPLHQLRRTARPMPHEPARHFRSRVGKRSRACRLQRSRNPPPRRRRCRRYGRLHQTRAGGRRRTGPAA